MIRHSFIIAPWLLFCLMVMNSVYAQQAGAGSSGVGYDYTPSTSSYSQGTTLVNGALNGVTPFIGSGTMDSRNVWSPSIPQPGSGGDGGGWCGYFIPGNWPYLTTDWTPAVNISCQGVYIGTPKYYWLRGRRYFIGYNYNCPPGYSVEKFVIDATYDRGFSCEKDGSCLGNYRGPSVSVSYGYTCIKND